MYTNSAWWCLKNSMCRLLYYFPYYVIKTSWIVAIFCRQPALNLKYRVGLHENKTKNKGTILYRSDWQKGWRILTEGSRSVVIVGLIRRPWRQAESCSWSWRGRGQKNNQQSWATGQCPVAWWLGVWCLAKGISIVLNRCSSGLAGGAAVTRVDQGFILAKWTWLNPGINRSSYGR